MKLFVLVILLWTAAQARIVYESEPNNFFDSADSIACGDTVSCANLVNGETDYFSLIAPGGDSLYFRTLVCDANINTAILLFDNAHSLIGFDDDGGAGQLSALGVFLPVSQQCYLQVIDPTGDSTFSYSLTVECRTVPGGAHDLCAQARQVTFWPYYDESSTFGAGSEIGTPSPDVYYRFALPTPGDVFVQVCAPAFNARVQLLLACGSGLMDDSDEGSCQLGADLFLFGLQAQPYYLLVEGTSAAQFGEFTIEISPVLQDCPVPQELKIFDVGGFPFLDWVDVPEADLYLIEQAPSGEGPFEALAVTNVSFWQDPIGFGLSRRFYRVRTLCE